MEELLDKIKERVAQRESPIRTVKAVAEAIGMTESGFYTMLKRGTTKQGTVLAIADALQVDVSYLTGDTNKSSKTQSDGEGAWHSITKEMREMRQVFEEELKAKNLQIAGLQRMLESVLGKSKGVANRPTSNEEIVFDDNVLEYLNGGLDLHRPLAFTQKTFTPGYGVGTTPLAHVANTVTVK